MATCENCGASFEPSNQPTEVTSLRVLCPKCDAERRERKKQMATQKPVPVPASAPPPQKPKPAAAPVAEVRAKPAAAPAGEIRAKPAAAPAPKISARPAEPRATEAPRARPAPAAARAKPEPKPAEARPSSRRRAAEEEPTEKSGRSMDVLREKQLLQQKQARTIMIGWIVAGGAVVIALVMMFIAKQKQQKLDDEAAALDKSRQEIWTTSDAMKLDTEEECKALIAYLDAKERHEIWINWDKKAGDLQSRRNKAQATLDTLVEKRTLRDTFDTMMKQLAAPEKLSIDDLKKLRQDLVNKIGNKQTLLDAEDVTKLATARQNADRAYTAKLLDDARTSAAAAKDLDSKKAALGKYTVAEDEINNLLDEALTKNIKDQGDFLTGQFKDAIKESDELATAIFTPEYIDKQPWKDLLSGDQSANWNPSKELPWKLEKGVLYLKGPNASLGGSGVISIGDKERWRDFVVEYDFTIVKGAFEVYYRLPKSVTTYTESSRFTTAESDPKSTVSALFSALSPGESYTAHMNFIGSMWTLECTDHDPIKTEDSDHNPLPVKWTHTRRGAIGFVIEPDCEIKVTKCHIKVLRQSGT